MHSKWLHILLAIVMGWICLPTIFWGPLFLFAIGIVSIPPNSSAQNQEERSKDTDNQPADREELKTQLLGDVAHEMRNMLSLVMGPLSLLRHDLEDASSDVQHQLAIAYRNASRLSKMIDQLTDLTQLESNQLRLKKEAYDIGEQVRHLLDSYESMADKRGITFTKLLPEQAITVNADRDRMEQVFSNLISNAIKFSPEGGYIDVAISCSKSGVWIQVKDTGEGIPKERQEHLFKRFYTRGSRKVDNRDGLGIGLSMSYEYVKKHGGELTVESAEGKGALFKVWLPLIQDDTLRGYSLEIDNTLSIKSAKEESEKALNNERKQQSHSGEDEQYDVSSDINVLVVEDDLQLRAYIEDVLMSKCFVTVHTATNVQQAWNRLENHPMDLVVTDLQLPGKDGFALIEQVQNSLEFHQLPILIITGRKDKQVRIKGFQIGINDFMSKPFDPQELVVRVQNLLRNKFERDLWIGSEFAREEQADTDTEQTKEPSAEPKIYRKVDRDFQESELELLDKLVDYVNRQLTNTTLTVEDLAFHLNLSKRQLYRKCKELTGLTPAHLIREIRLQRAQSLLEQNKVSHLNELIHAVGYNNSGYFARLYEERFGLKPFK
ncbi:MAG: hybrid sensor histidine kinase/response regulator transcription factor [Bacteroidota bacterium]